MIVWCYIFAIVQCNIKFHYIYSTATWWEFTQWEYWRQQVEITGMNRSLQSGYDADNFMRERRLCFFDKTGGARAPAELYLKKRFTSTNKQ